MADSNLIALETGPINTQVLITTVEALGVGIQKAPVTEQDYNLIISDCCAIMRVRARKMGAPFVECATCRRKYPDTPDYESCPFCGSDDIIMEEITELTPGSTFVSPIQEKVATIKDKQLGD